MLHLLYITFFLKTSSYHSITLSLYHSITLPPITLSLFHLSLFVPLLRPTKFIVAALFAEGLFFEPRRTGFLVDDGFRPFDPCLHFRNIIGFKRDIQRFP